jgi:hypothetical protein
MRKILTKKWLAWWSCRLGETAVVKKPYWFMRNAGGVEEGTFCRECAEKLRLKLAEANKDKPKVLECLDRLDGGWSQESDTVVTCKSCHELLEYTLTDYGAESEWDHFSEHGIDLNSTTVACEIDSILLNGAKLRDLKNVRVRGLAAFRRWNRRHMREKLKKRRRAVYKFARSLYPSVNSGDVKA